MDNHLMQMVLSQTTFWLCVVLFVRLFTYQRGDARHRLGISLMAWLVMGSAGSGALLILKGQLVLPASAWPLVVLLAIFAFAVFRARGNMARVWRVE
ncbi:phage holin family protein [Pseudomonas tohonis]|nr:hypothetical protein L682_27245 [Pseudomonas alcaligenes OT 69]MDN4144950.1 phage holin family protein [Pseudomonas tohonis]